MPKKTYKKKSDIKLLNCYGCGEPLDKDDLKTVWTKPYGLYCQTCLDERTDERTGLAEENHSND